jgi:signal transduction histidine kinase
LAALALLCHAGGYAQTGLALADSLEAVINTSPAEGREKFIQYFDLFDLGTDLDRTMKYAREGAERAREQSDIYWEAEFDSVIGNTFFYKGQLDSARVYYDNSDELRRRAVRHGWEDTERNGLLELYLLVGKGGIDLRRGNFESALENYFGALAVAERIGDASETVYMYRELAEVYQRMSNTEQAEVYYRKMEQLSRAMGDSVLMANAYLKLTQIYNTRGNAHEALRYTEAAYRMLTSVSVVDSWLMMEASMRMTEAWRDSIDSPKAMEYAQETVEHARKTGVSSHLASALYTLSAVHLRRGENELSERVALEALAADSTDVYVNSILYGNIAQANVRMGRSERGIEYYRKTLDANRAWSNRNFQATLSEMEVKYETEKKEARIVALEEERRLMMWLSAAVGTVMLMALVAFFFLWRWTVLKKRTEATQALLDGECAERTRLARDLHDGLGSMLTAIRLGLENVKNEEAPDVGPSLDMLGESIRELRRISHHLMPEALQNEGLKPALEAFCRTLPGVRCEWFGSEERVDGQMELAVYRIAHELVNNAVKHAGASEIVVQVMRGDDYLACTVRDDGCGFDVGVVSGSGSGVGSGLGSGAAVGSGSGSRSHGMGLRSVRDRVASRGGRLMIDSRVGRGTEVNVNFRL